MSLDITFEGKESLIFIWKVVSFIDGIWKWIMLVSQSSTVRLYIWKLILFLKILFKYFM